MSKELEEFKEEMISRITFVLNQDGHPTMVKRDLFKDLMKKLKPKPEFVEGEHVIMFDISKENHQIRVFSSMNEGDDCFNFQDSHDTCWKYCEKIDALPMNMTAHDGSGTCPDGVNSNTLVHVKLTNERYSGGMAHNFNWSSIAQYQILKDLNAGG